MLLAAGSALVAGGALETNMQTKKVRAVRAFYFQRRLIKVGDVVDLPSIFATEMCAANKAELVPERAREVVPQDGKKGDGNAR